MNFHTLSCKKLSTAIIPIFFKTIFKRGFSNEVAGFLGRGIDFDILWGHFYCDGRKITFYTQYSGLDPNAETGSPKMFVLIF